MEKNEQKPVSLQICNLTEEEMNDPYVILREFVEDVSLAAIRNLIVTMRDICISTENVFYGGPAEREDLLYVTQRIIRFLEASYIQLKKELAPVGRIITPDFTETEQFSDFRQLRVMERTFFKRSSTGRVSMPCITLLGKWLAMAGFSPGDEITIASKFQTLLITMSKEWDKGSQEFKMTA